MLEKGIIGYIGGERYELIPKVIEEIEVRKNKEKWISFSKQTPKEGERIIIAESNYKAYDTYFEFDKEADYSNSKWCLWPF